MDFITTQKVLTWIKNKQSWHTKKLIWHTNSGTIRFNITYETKVTYGYSRINGYDSMFRSTVIRHGQAQAQI